MQFPRTFFLVALSFFAVKAMAFISKTVPINPANSKKYNIQIVVENHDPASLVLEILITGSGGAVGNEILVYQLKSAINLPKTPQLGIGYEWPGAPKPTRKINVKKSPNGNSWSVKIKIQRSAADRTYVSLPPGENVSDGTTYILDLPAFVRVQGDK